MTPPAVPGGGRSVTLAGMTVRRRSAGVGYVLAAAGAAMFALNGTLSKALIEDHGMPALRLAELRSLVTCLLLLGFLALSRPALLRVERRDVPRLAFFGIAGLAAVNGAYYLSIERLDIGVALAIQYLGPLLLLIWLAVAHRRRLPRGLWGAAALSLAGAALVVHAYDPSGIDGLGVVFAVAAAIAFATYLFSSEQAGHRYAPATTLLWGFGFATLFWLVVQPPWSFPFGTLDSTAAMLLALGVAVIGTLLPFACLVASVRHIPAPRAAIVATLEPVLGAAIAWVALGESLAAAQVAGGLLVVAAVLWVQSQRPSLEAETAPAYRSAREEAGDGLEVAAP